MDFGYFAMPLHPPGTDYTRSLHGDLDQIVELDRLGYREAWIGEHFTSEWENIPAPDLFIAAALERTKNIVLATGVSCLPNHNPFVLAHRIAQLDHMARGRFHWGVGSGGFPGDLEVFGYGEGKKDNRIMTRQAVEAVLELWRSPKPGNHNTNYFDYTVPRPEKNIGLRVYLKPYQKPHPPIGVAGVTPKSSTLALAGERGWIPMSINLVPEWVLKTHWVAVQEGAKRAGRRPQRKTWRIAREVFVGTTARAAMNEAKKGVLARDWNQYFYPLLKRDGMLKLCKIDQDMPDRAVTADYMAENVWIVGGPDEVAEKIAKLHAAVGGFGVLLAMAHEWAPAPRWKESFRLLRQVVQPKLAKAGI
ncbi:MAG: LLM class flavin-dependent oxidoreductase [SAR202 cluster bacterium]|nr:LLM class flavin-dependent oxidoreductase [SAR202 cluster bacterium]